jgi:hypothetical protein
VPGQAVALVRNDDSHLEERYRFNKNEAPKFDWLHPGDILPSRAQAQTADAVHALVCIHATHVLVGTYGSSGNVGVRVDWDLRVLRWPSGEVIAAQAFTGHAPDDIGEFKQGESNVARRGRTSSEAYAWMKELIAHQGPATEVR